MKRKFRKEKNLNVNINTQCIANQIREANELKVEEMALRDRVDISRKEYEEMKKEIEYLRFAHANYNAFLEAIRAADYWGKVVPGTVKVVENIEPASLKSYVIIKFEVKDTSHLPIY